MACRMCTNNTSSCCRQPRRASYCEIYNEGLHDLIRYNNRAQLAERWDPGHGFHVPELAKVATPTLQDMYKVLAH
jgi:hypothetical protein